MIWGYHHFQKPPYTAVMSLGRYAMTLSSNSLMFMLPKLYTPEVSQLPPENRHFHNRKGSSSSPSNPRTLPYKPWMHIMNAPKGRCPQGFWPPPRGGRGKATQTFRTPAKPGNASPAKHGQYATNPLPKKALAPGLKTIGCPVLPQCGSPLLRELPSCAPRTPAGGIVVRHTTESPPPVLLGGVSTHC